MFEQPTMGLVTEIHAIIVQNGRVITAISLAMVYDSAESFMTLTSRCLESECWNRCW